MATTYLRYILLTFTYFMLCLNTPATEIWRQHWLTIYDGLPGLTVTSIKEDPSGKIWIGTSNGISLFNGVSLKNYVLPRLHNGPANYCFDIDIDAKGNLWAATRDGVFMLDRYADNFERISDITKAECVACASDTIYIGTRTGLFVIDSNRRSRQIDIAGGTVTENSSIRCLRLAGGNVWLTMRNGLVRLNRATGKSTRHRMELPSGLSRFDICDGKFFVGTKNNGLYVFNPADGNFRHISSIGNIISDVNACGDSAVCISVNGDGGYVLDARKETVKQHFSANGNDKFALPDNSLTTFIRTRIGTDWFGLLQNGLSYSYKEYNFFRPYKLADFTTRGMKVKTAYTDRNKRLIATGNGFWIADEQNQTSMYFDTGNMGCHTITDFCRHGDYYYIATYDGGLLRLDVKTMKLGRLPDCPKLNYATVRCLSTDRTGRLWAATSEGLFVIENDEVTHNYTEKNSKIPEGIYSIWFDSNNNGWIGSARGLCLYLSRENAFKTDGFPKGFFDKTNGLRVTGCGDTIYAWSETKLFKTDLRMSRFEEINIPDGVLSERLIDFEADNDGSLWMVTEEGLFLTDAKQRQTIHFGAGSGIERNIMNEGCLRKDNRYIWVGTYNGLMMAEKKQLHNDIASSYRPKLELDYVTTGEHSAGYGDMMRINDTRELSVKWNITIPRMVIMPVLTDYSKQGRDFYEYRLDDGRWNICPLGQAITIDNLTPGKHSLQIRMAGITTNTVSYTISTYPAPLFYAEILLTTIMVLLLWWWNRWRRNTNILLREHIQTEDALIEELTNPTIPKQEEERHHTEESDAADHNTKRMDNGKYRKSRVTDQELAQLFNSMDEYVKEKRPYRHKDLKMSDIPSALGVSPSLLSQVFTLYLKEPYYDYINKYRLEEFKKFINYGKHKQFTIMALSEQCGFKKTSFFSTFRKVEGMTPTEFIQKHLQ